MISVLRALLKLQAVSHAAVYSANSAASSLAPKVSILRCKFVPSGAVGSLSVRDSAVGGLFFRGGPSDITGLVVAIIVDAVD